MLKDQLLISSLKVNEDGRILIFDSNASVAEISKLLILNNLNVEEINKHSQSLEDYFLSIINGGKQNEEINKARV